MEARVGIEPTHKGFADLSLTTWVPRLWLQQTRNRPHCTFRRADTLDCCVECTAGKEVVGAGDRGRTGDIFLGKEALYH